MKRFLFVALMALLALILLAAALVGLYVLGQRLGWPWWTGPVILCGLFGLILGALLLKRWLIRRREEEFVKRIIEQDEATIAAAPAKERPQLRDLQERWRQAIEILRTSRIRQHGNPLYVLPWYLVMGEAGSGKTTAIKSARLATPLTDVGPAQGISGTRNCDWWFCEDAIILDTAGRYAIPVDEEHDKEEWRKFLSLLVKYRKREPLNGLVVTIAADKLLDAGLDKLVEEGRSIRARVDELMRAIGARIPVYVLVTKTDKILGLAELAETLPDKALEGAMGQVVPLPGLEIGEALEGALDAISEQLRALRCRIVLCREGSPSGLLLLPGEIDALRSGLLTFARALFAENPYQETPLCRGLYFSSARQEGIARSQLLQGLSTLDQGGQQLRAGEKGLFLRGLFARVLPSDRGLFTPLAAFLRRRRLSEGLGLLAWNLVMLSLCGLLTASFLKNKTALEDFTEDFSLVPRLSGDIEQDLLLMDRFRIELVRMGERDRDWWLPRMGLTQSLQVEKDLKLRFCALLEEGALGQWDRQFQDMLARVSTSDSDAVVAKLAEHLVRRAKLIDAKLKGAGHAQLAAMPQPTYELLQVFSPEALSEEAFLVSGLALAWLEWTPDQASLIQSRTKAREQLTAIAAKSNVSLHWLVSWANETGLDGQPITLEQFWGLGSLHGHDNAGLPPAFTRQGKARIDAFLKEIQASLERPQGLEPRRVEFERWYEDQYLLAWESFVGKAAQARHQITDADRRKDLAGGMASMSSPYFTLLDVMAEELGFLKGKAGLPGWVELAWRLREAKLLAQRQEADKSAPVVVRTVREGEQGLEQALGKGSGSDIKRIEAVRAASKELEAYAAALEQILPVATSPAVAYAVAADFYPYSTVQHESKSPFYAAANSISKLKSILGTRGAAEQPFWDLASGPLQYLLDYTSQEAACELQTRWEEEVLSQIQSVPESKLGKTLFEPSAGLVWKFLKGSAAPFLGQNRRGHFAKVALGSSLPVSGEFLAFLSRTKTQEQMRLPSYPLTINAQPLDVNSDAQEEPSAGILNIQCANATHRLENYNYPVSMSLDWAPDVCGDVSLDIKFSSFTLTKKYAGVRGVPMFLADFRTGVRRFTPNDFPDSKASLEDLGVREITVKYQLEGSVPILKLQAVKPLKVPEVIAQCWR
ncbi:type VI secretion protein IcmF/TssM N-terminal domain-containing protein [Desulfocurvibacter africanus]|uniref:Type VI secretion system component TssM1 N-terminal domain-containing protein n=1 Tax=Desulfocurvibacter africanus subsp. africanus str. Walvis Bay TaxID=690850 RepID=F3YWS2_DESAF|nr:type VI secretion protein IcmF/TssM N-terminal domain-containing protein [Desulfocurvibacter africanus]EGJ50565.1 hypothetical protein Desaf_2238 [Desulfocurvibacter africanus subsp. africanus str. Walvis Bay]